MLHSSHDMQQVGTVAARLIVNKKQKLHMIYEIPGDDVKVLTNTLFECCSRLEGVQAMPFDLAGIMAACFLESATMGFNMEMQTIYKQTTNSFTWQQVTTTVCCRTPLCIQHSLRVCIHEPTAQIVSPV